MLYPSGDSGIDYRGIRTAPYMIRFLDAIMNPIVRITHKEQLMELLVNYDVSVSWTKINLYYVNLYRDLMYGRQQLFH